MRPFDLVVPPAVIVALIGAILLAFVLALNPPPPK